MEQLKRQLEEEKRSQADGGVVYRGMLPQPPTGIATDLTTAGRGSMKYRDPENSSGRGSFADTDRSFGRPRAYDGIPRPEKRYYAKHYDRSVEEHDSNKYARRDTDPRDGPGRGEGRDNGRSRRELSPLRRDDAHRGARSRSRERGRADADDWRMGRKQTLEGRMADRSPVRFAKATAKSPSPVAPARRSPSPAKQRRGEMLTDSESEMELDED